MEIVLRRMEPAADLTHVRGLLSGFEAEVAARVLTDYGIVFADLAPGAGLLTDIDGLLVPPGCLFVAEVDGVLAGTCGLKDLGDGVGEIKRMYVDPEFRGHGVARALVERLLVEAEAAGFGELLLESAIWMVEAHALYRSVGFEDTADYSGREFHGVAGSEGRAIFMRRPVGATAQSPRRKRTSVE